MNDNATFVNNFEQLERCNNVEENDIGSWTLSYFDLGHQILN